MLSPNRCAAPDFPPPGNKTSPIFDESQNFNIIYITILWVSNLEKHVDSADAFF